MTRRLACVMALCASLLYAGPAAAEERKGSFEISPFISYVDFNNETRLDANPGSGVRVGYNFTSWLGAELSWHRSKDIDFTNVLRPNADLDELHAVAVLNWKRTGQKFWRRAQHYVFAGVGQSDYDPAVGLDSQEARRLTVKAGGHGVKYRPAATSIETLSTAVFGIGSRVYLNEGLALRLDVRFVQAIAADFTNLEPSFGISYSFGGSGGPDRDGDGVVDYRDDCPDTPKGAVVNKRGCPSDGDGDGVFDGIDQCADTPKGVVVDAKGCPVDSDGDGVPDGPDQCKDTPKGAKVDEKGCPVDSDGDGVADGLDECESTPKGAVVDEKGCPKDADGDGVADGIDQCPKTPKGVKVDAKGCPVDSDNDGVPDGIDECPDSPPGSKVDKKGCPLVPPPFEKDQVELILKGVTFDTDKATLKPESSAVLDTVAASLVAWPAVRVEIQGHTDSTGSEAHNMRLSEARASAVRDYLIAKGVAADRMTSRGYGESQPIADNATEQGRAQNRRVELHKLE